MPSIPIYDRSDEIATITADFTKNLGPTDTDVQKALKTIDQMSGGGAEVDPISLHLDQTTGQSIVNGKPTFSDGIKLGNSNTYLSLIGNTLQLYVNGTLRQEWLTEPSLNYVQDESGNFLFDENGNTIVEE